MHNKAPKYTPGAKSAPSAGHTTRCFVCPLALRYDFPRLYMKFLIILIAVFLAGCSAPTPKQNQIVVDPALLGTNAATGWIAYGLALASWEGSNDTDQNLYEREVFARGSVARIWAELRAKGEKLEDEDLDALATVEKAGYMREYVWYFLRKEDWLEPSGLNLKDFQSWLKTNLSNHVAVTNPGVSFGN